MDIKHSSLPFRSILALRSPSNSDYHCLLVFVSIKPQKPSKTPYIINDHQLLKKPTIIPTVYPKFLQAFLTLLVPKHIFAISFIVLDNFQNCERPFWIKCLWFRLVLIDVSVEFVWVKSGEKEKGGSLCEGYLRKLFIVREGVFGERLGFINTKT